MLSNINLYVEAGSPITVVRSFNGQRFPGDLLLYLSRMPADSQLQVSLRKFTQSLRIHGGGYFQLVSKHTFWGSKTKPADAPKQKVHQKSPLPTP